MKFELREVSIIGIVLLSLQLASCYAHYSWVSVQKSQLHVTAPETRMETFSEREILVAVEVATEVAQSLGLEVSHMNRFPPPEPTPENPFRRLALFQGKGANNNLLLTVAIREDRSTVRYWISDLDHSRETEFVSELVKLLRENLVRVFPTREIMVGNGRKLRFYSG